MSIIKKYGITNIDELMDLSKKLNFKLNFVGYTDDLTKYSAEGCNSTSGRKCGPGSYIFNIGDYVGTHWTAGFIKGDTMFYFDSYAVPPEDDLIDILENNSRIKNIIYNSNFQFQDINENLCGVWCVIFLYHMNHSKLPKLIDRFNEFKAKYKNLSA